MQILQWATAQNSFKNGKRCLQTDVMGVEP